MTDFLVFRPGCEVQILGGNKGVVKAVMIESHHVRYKVIWPTGETLTEMWLDDFLVCECKATATIGFK